MPPCGSQAILAASEPMKSDLTTFGKCECEGQITVSNDCSSAFYCGDPEAENAQIGVAISCGKDAVATLNTISNQLVCQPRPARYTCLGHLITGCPAPVQEAEEDAWIIDCQCANEIRVSPDCKHAFKCDRAGSDSSGGLYQMLCCAHFPN